MMSPNWKKFPENKPAARGYYLVSVLYYGEIVADVDEWMGKMWRTWSANEVFAFDDLPKPAEIPQEEIDARLADDEPDSSRKGER